MSVCEAEAMVAGYRKRNQDALRLAAWHAANTMNVWLDKKHKISSPGELLGEPPPQQMPADGRALQRHWMSDPTMG